MSNNTNNADYSISNRAIQPSEGDYNQIASNNLAPFIVRLWRIIVILGAISLLIYFIWGAMDWLMSDGDQEKIQKAKKKISSAIAGMIVLASSFAILAFAKNIFGFDILNFVWPTP